MTVDEKERIARLEAQVVALRRDLDRMEDVVNRRQNRIEGGVLGIMGIIAYQWAKSLGLLS